MKYKNIDSLIIENAFNYYRESGFPFVNMTNHELLLDFKKLLNNYPKITKRFNFLGEKFYSVGTGLAGIEFCKHFVPHQYKVKINGSAGSPYDAYLDDRYLKKAIEMSIQYTGSIDDKKLRSYLSRVSWHQFATNFRPLAAKAIYTKYAKNNSIVYDYCAGFGGRLLGFLSSKYSSNSLYIGVDPSTESVNGLNNIINFLNFNKNAMIYKTCAEDFIDKKFISKIDLAFSSPPYFSKELYSNEKTQSYKKYPKYYLWKTFFLYKIIRNCYKLLKPGGYFIINIANVKIKEKLYKCEDDAIMYATYKFGKYKDLLLLPMNMIFGDSKSKNFECDETGGKAEKLYVFQK